MMQRNLHTPLTSSAGRLSDAVRSIVGVRQICRFEGQPAMELEFEIDKPYGFELVTQQPCLVLDWASMVRSIVGDMKEEAPRGHIAAKFHNTLAEMMIQVATASGQDKLC